MGITFLKNIAEIQTGYSFRNKINHNADGDISVIQMKDLDTCFVSLERDFIKIQRDTVKESYLVQKGDLFFKSRGSVNNSSLLIDEIVAVLSAPLLLIRINNKEEILPEYLNWYLGQSIAQSYFNSVSEGTSQKMINKVALENFEILIPSIEKQKIIVEISRLLSKESEIEKKLSQHKEKYYASLLMNIVKGD